MFRRCVAFLLVLLASALPALADGSAQSNVLVCVATADGSTVAPCASGQGPAIVAGYVLSPSDYAWFQAASTPFDPTLGAGYFAFGLGLVVLTWCTSYGIGLVLQLVKHA